MKKTSESITHLCHEWQLSNIRSLVDLPGRNYVARVYSAVYKTDVVLKILIEETQEAQVLRLFDDKGYVQLLEYAPEYNALLIENIVPGNTLSTLFPQDDIRSLEIMVSLIKRIQAADIHNYQAIFPTVEQWMEEMRTCTNEKIPPVFLSKAYTLSQELLRSKQPRYLLHGDLHHENILQCASDPQDDHSWVAIDPKGVIGPLEFEVIRFLMNPIPDLLQQPDAKGIIQRRMEHLHALCGFDKERLWQWLFVQAVMSACWTSEDTRIFFDYFIRIARMIHEDI